MTISNQSAEDIHHQVERAAMSGMCNLRTMLEKAVLDLTNMIGITESML